MDSSNPSSRSHQSHVASADADECRLPPEVPSDLQSVSETLSETLSESQASIHLAGEILPSDSSCPDHASRDDLLLGGEPKAHNISALPPLHKGRVVDPSVVEEGDEPFDSFIEFWSSEPPAAVDIASRRTTNASARREAFKKKRKPLPDNPSFRPYTHDSRPSSQELLDSDRLPIPIPKHRPAVASASVLSPTMTAVFGALFGLAGIVAIFALLQKASPASSLATLERIEQVDTPGSESNTRDVQQGGAGTQASKNSEVSTSSVQSATKSARQQVDASGRLVAKKYFTGLSQLNENSIVLPGPWRVASLGTDPNIKLVTGSVGLDPFVTTLQAKGLSTSETYRVLGAFKPFDAFKRLRKHDKFTIAIERAKSRVVGFELEVSALEVYQAKQNEDGALVGSRLDMQVATRMRETSVRIVEGKLSESLKRAGLRDSVVSLLDKAFDGRASVANMAPGSTLRVILQEKTALGRFAQYEHVEALEYISSKADSKPLRLYRFKDGSRYGYFNQDGREPYRGSWRTPCPGAPISSHFNPKRMHPILKRVHPHNGTDFAAATGTPIHATSFGTVDFIGPRGPAGNLVILKHAGKIESYYMHMHRFASGLKQGDRVESFQVIGYVGTTGRSTGPHLHFGIKKDGVWIDPLSLKLDGDRLVSADLRSDFDRVRSQMDEKLDAIELAPPVEQELAVATDQAQKVPNDPSNKSVLSSSSNNKAGADKPEQMSTKPQKTLSKAADDEELEPGGVDDEPIDEAL